MEYTNKIDNFTGCVPDPIDIRDYVYQPLGANVLDIDWNKGYDIEEVLGHKITPKNQFQSYSCVGQATATYVAVLDKIETGIWNENSAKAIYSQISLGLNRGAYLRDGMKLITDWGSLFESKLKSYKEDGTTDELFMTDKSWLNEEVNKIAKTLQAKDYRLVNGIGIDIFANAIKDGHGALIGVTGNNNGTWLNEFPAPPKLDTPQNQLWGHALYAGKFKMINGKKYIGVLNSWGNIGKDGWQWLGEEWFADNGRWIFNPWTLIDKPNNNMTLKKEIGKPHVYFTNDKTMTKVMIADMETLNALGGEYVEVASLSTYTNAGTFVWVDRTIN